MKGGGFRSKPSESHIIWTRETRDGAATKRLDETHFEKWATHCGFDFDTDRRVDHARADEQRQQYRCVFTWETTDGETIEFDDETWSLGTQRTPGTFVEIDGSGVARITGREFEAVYDIVELYHKGPVLLFETADGERKRLNARRFLSDPRRHQRDAPDE